MYVACRVCGMYRTHPLHIKISRCILIKGRLYDKVYAELKSSYRRQGKGSSHSGSGYMGI